VDFLIDGDEKAKLIFIFAHGAGGPMRSAWMATVARGIAAYGIRVVRFEFPYMAAKKKAPDREPVLLEWWREVIRAHVAPPPSAAKRSKNAAEGGVATFIGGKSMGGRIASMVADEMNVRGLVCFGYPFHPPGKPERLRTKHLETLKTPALILQGTRDPFGSPQDVAGYTLSPSIRVEWLEGGDHSVKDENLVRAVALASEFMKKT
jgi:predicted alpha/beta-hydrolase family hydrolase